MIILLLWDLRSTLCVVDHLWPLIYVYMYYVCVLNNCMQCEQQTLISIWDNYIIGTDAILPHLREWNLKARPESLNQQTIIVVSWCQVLKNKLVTHLDVAIELYFCYKGDVRNLSPFGDVLYLKMLLSSIKLNTKDLIWNNNSQHRFW